MLLVACNMLYGVVVVGCMSMRFVWFDDLVVVRCSVFVVCCSLCVAVCGLLLVFSVCCLSLFVVWLLLWVLFGVCY